MVGSILFSLFIIVSGLFVGKSIHHLWQTGRIAASMPLDKVMNRMTKTSLLGFNPIVLIGAFWLAELSEWRLAALPLLGLFSLALGGVLAIGAAKLLGLTRSQTGSMFVQGSFTNIGSFGTLFCFLFLGEASLVFVAMYRLLEEFMYYLVGFPVAKMFGEGERESVGVKERLQRLARDPFIVVSLLAIVIGGGLNLSGIERPECYTTLIEWLVPLATLLMVLSIGFGLDIKSMRGYAKESLAISAVKFVLVPAGTVGLAYALGFGQLGDTALLTILIVSAMPPAFISLIPPQIYKLDTNLAGASFLFNTFLMPIVVPYLYIVIVLMQAILL